MGWDKFPYLTPTDEDYLLPAEEFIAKFDGILYEPLFKNPLEFWFWVVASTALLVMYAVFIKKILFAENLGKGVTGFCAANLIVGCLCALIYD